MNTCTMRRLAGIGGVLLMMALLIAPTGAAQAPTPEFITLVLTAPPYRLIPTADGHTVIEAEGCGITGEVGQPLLPHQLIDVALPPDVAWDSLTLTVRDVQTAVVPGTFKLRTAVPDQPGTGDPHPFPSPYQGEGRAPSPYQGEGWGDGTLPATIAETGQMRKWHLARLDFCPFQYDATSGQLRVMEQATVELRFTRTGETANADLLADTVLDDVAAGRVINYAQAQAWYPRVDRPNAVTYDYVIITTNAIQTHSTKLDDFVAHKQSKGHSVLVVTETQYGGLTGQTPNGREEKIRQWLKNNYATYGIKYVLLIGNPTPGGTGTTDVPMKMCWPRNDESDDKESPTDYFYADLTGDWNKDGDSYFGEYVGDYSGVTGGVNLMPEVYVGRIPFYGSYTDLDNILQKTMNYANEATINWRKSILLPMGFQDVGYDGAPLAEQMWADYLNGAGYTRWRQYQDGHGACSLNSSYTTDQELRGGTVVRDRWAAHDYGIVCWWGHGSATSASVGYSGCWDGTLFDNTQTSSLDDAHPAFTYQCSCTNGYPENTNNLQYAVLKRGGIATVSASRVSWFNTGVGYGEFDGSTTNSGIGYEYVKRVVAGNTASESLYNAKSSMTPESNTRLMNYYDFNLYGDPAIRITASGPALTPRLFLPLVLRSYTPPASWTTILSENFEGSFPGAWSVFDNNGSSYGVYTWGKRTCRPYAGSYSGWGVGGGTNGAALSCGSNYPDNADSWMVYGPFSLVGATAGDFSYKLWLYTEGGGNDSVSRLASINGTNFYGTFTSGNSGGWIDRTLDLTAVPILGNLMGQPNVWVALRFYSNGSTNYAEGGYVDDIVLRKCMSSSCTGLSSAPPDTVNSEIVEFPIAVTLPK